MAWYGQSKQLPDKLSDLIELAIRDARKLDRRVYYPNAGHWHHPSYSEDDSLSCKICFAGAVIAGTLGAPVMVNVAPSVPWWFPGWSPTQDNWRKLKALELVRAGALVKALRSLDLPFEEFQSRFPNFSRMAQFPGFIGWEEFDKFCTDMEWAVERLRAHRV